MITQGPQRQNRAEAVLETIMRSAHPMLDWTDYRGRDRRRAFWSFALLAAVAILIGHLMICWSSDWFLATRRCSSRPCSA